MSEQPLCPQCGVGEFYISECSPDENLTDNSYYVWRVCLCCGYYTGFDLIPSYREETNPLPGYGVKSILLDKTLDLGDGRFERFPLDVDYEKELELFDRLVSISIVDPINSYITKVNGNRVELLRGSILEHKHYMGHCYRFCI